MKEVGGEARRHPLRAPEPPEPPKGSPGTRHRPEGWGVMGDPVLRGTHKDHHYHPAQDNPKRPLVTKYRSSRLLSKRSLTSQVMG